MVQNLTSYDNDDLLETKKYKARLSIALKAAKICVYEVDIVNQLYTFFENSEDIFGVSGDRILQDVQPFSKLKPAEYQKAVSGYFSHPDDVLVIDRAFQSVFEGKPITYEARMRAGGSNFKWCKLDVTPIMENNVPVKMIGVITDITNIKMKTEKLENAVKYDIFTGVYNKNSSIDFIQEHLTKRPNQTHALILVDIDNFKNTNDRYGHDVGDHILLLVAEKLKKSFRKNDIIGRFGGDEFIIFIPNIPNMDWLAKKLGKLVQCEEDGYRCTNSIGVSMFPQNATDFDMLFKKADEALYQSKQTKASYTFYSNQQNAEK